MRIIPTYRTKKYMAKIATFEGNHWFYIGNFKNEEDARKYAIKYAKKYLIGTKNSVKKIETKIEWVRNDRRKEANF